MKIEHKATFTLNEHSDVLKQILVLTSGECERSGTLSHTAKVWLAYRRGTEGDNDGHLICMPLPLRTVRSVLSYNVGDEMPACFAAQILAHIEKWQTVNFEWKEGARTRSGYITTAF